GGVRYLVVGGLAVNLYGVPRVTQDIDIIISTDKKNIEKMISSLKKLGYKPRLPVAPEDLMDDAKVKDWITNRNLKAFSFIHNKNSYKSVDILLVHPLDFEKAFRNKTIKRVNEIDIYLASIEDLIETKQIAGRAQDISDVEHLERVEKMGGKTR
ncbi:MAG: hypothetical protein QCI38_03890, partial [Candidatus Thermoplasmatota archaeon]|nr:hypothetical protein [Candidatus Thermoplasmatota archaeon]